jgi:hypothetical protein
LHRTAIPSMCPLLQLSTLHNSTATQAGSCNENLPINAGSYDSGPAQLTTADVVAHANPVLLTLPIFAPSKEGYHVIQACCPG